MSWVIVSGPERISDGDDSRRFRWLLTRDGQERVVIVELTESVAASEPDTLPSPLDDAARTCGRSIVEANAHRVEPPQQILVHTLGIRITPSEGAYEPGDYVFAREGDTWVEAVVERRGDYDEAVPVKDNRVQGGEYRRDVVWVRRTADDTIEKYRYEEIRATPPRAT